MTVGNAIVVALALAIPMLVFALERSWFEALQAKLEALGPDVAGKWLVTPPALGPLTPKVSHKLNTTMLFGDITPPLADDRTIVSLIWRIRVLAALKIGLFVILVVLVVARW